MKARRRRAELLARTALSTWNGGGFQEKYFLSQGRHIVDAVERVMAREVWWRRVLRWARLLKH